jgi:hypothetical protein
MGLGYSPGERAQVTVVDGPAFGDGGAGSFRFNFATPHSLRAEMIERIAGVVNDGSLGGRSKFVRDPAVTSLLKRRCSIPRRRLGAWV